MTKPSEVELLAALPRLIEETLAHRQQVRSQRASILATHQKLREEISNYSRESRNTLSCAQPNIGSSEASAWPLLQQWLEHLAGARTAFANAANAVSAAQAVMSQASTRKTAAKAKVESINGRWFGIGFLQKLFNKRHTQELADAVEELTGCDSAVQNAQANIRTAEEESRTVSGAFDDAKKGTIAALENCETMVRQHFDTVLESNAKEWNDGLAKLPPFFRADWSEAAWRNYNLTLNCRVPFWVAGTAKENNSGAGTSIAIPYLTPLLGSNRATIIKGGLATSQSLMQGLVLQLATMLPYGATFTLMDPSGAGKAFPMQRSLPFVRPPGVDLARDLSEVMGDIQRIIATYLDAETKSFEDLPEQIQANERYEFIVAANFPVGYDRVTIETLQKIAKNGPAAGRYLFLQVVEQKDLPHGLNWADFGDLLRIDTDNAPAIAALGGSRVNFLRTAEGPAQKIVLERLAAAKQPESNVAWSDVIGAEPADWWKETSEKIIQAPIGSSGRDRFLHVWYGVKDGRPCAHGILAAMSGAGKSNLYHVLIGGLATRYGPEELNLYLIDGKMGVEFQPYRRLPHARVVALHSAPELSRSVLAELISEMERRNEEFARIGVVDLPGYRSRGSPTGPLPRIVLMIDEYQELFEEDRHSQASAHLLMLAQQGRSVGIHLLLGSQRFGAPGMLNQAAIFGSMHLRMAMQMSQPDIQGLTEFGRNGRRLVEQCDRSGKIVVNSNSGDDNSNEFGKVALLNQPERVAILDALVKKADEEWPAERRFATVVFDGREQPNFSENPQVVDLIRLPKRPTGDRWREIAVASAHQQGFGVTDWYEGEYPMALWVGQELNVHGQARVILRRRAMENLIFVGESLNATYGMLAALLCSVAINVPATGVRLAIVDRALPGTPWERTLELVTEQLLKPLGYSATRTREPSQLTAWMAEWLVELDRRAGLDEDTLQKQPAWILIIAGADRLPLLSRVTNNYGSSVESPDGEKLRALYTRGPALGLHLVISFPAASSMKQCLDRAQLENFKHRIVTQIAESDSFLLLGNDHAAKLQRGEARPLFAICYDQIGGHATKFKPYTSNAHMTWLEQLGELKTNLSRWKEKSHVDG